MTGRMCATVESPGGRSATVTSEGRRLLVIASLALLGRGSEGPVVIRLQALLNATSEARLAEDGIFGPRTEAAVRRFQAARHLLVDGVVGPHTWTALLSVPGPYPEVAVAQPQPFDLVDDPILIAGSGRAFEGTIATRVRDAGGHLLAESFVQGGSFALSNFQGRLAVGAVPPTPQGTVEVGPAPASDEGPPPEVVVIPVVFGRALDETYLGFHPRTVRPGDTLSGLAQAFYGDSTLFPRIFEANRNLIADPDLIVPGQVLRIPVGAATQFPPGG